MQVIEIGMGVPEKDGASNPDAAQGTPATGPEKQHKADAPFGAWSNAAFSGYKGVWPRVAVFLAAD